MKNKYYVYLHIKETTGEPFYVGKGKGRRAFISNRRSKYWKNVVNKYGFDIIFLEKDLTEEEAFEREKYWIKRIGRKQLNEGPLINLTDGGDGCYGTLVSDSTKQKVSENNCRFWSNKSIPNEMRQKISNTLFGRFRGVDNVNSKKVVDLSTGIFFDSLKEATDALNLDYKSTSYFLTKAKINKTNLIYI